VSNIQQINSADYPRLPISISSDKALNPFVDLYEVKGSTLTKIGGGGLWHIVKASEILPKTGKFSLSFKVIESELNCFEVGITPQDFVPIENKINEKALGFHFANGKIHDTKGVKEKKTTSWRAVCEPAEKGKVGTIELSIDS
jgi:hypothetical protein